MKQFQQGGGATGGGSRGGGSSSTTQDSSSSGMRRTQIQQKVKSLFEKSHKFVNEKLEYILIMLETWETNFKRREFIAFWERYENLLQKYMIFVDQSLNQTRLLQDQEHFSFVLQEFNKMEVEVDKLINEIQAIIVEFKRPLQQMRQKRGNGYLLGTQFLKGTPHTAMVARQLQQHVVGQPQPRQESTGKQGGAAKR